MKKGRIKDDLFKAENMNSDLSISSRLTEYDIFSDRSLTELVQEAEV